MSLLSEHMREIACELEIICTRAGIAIDYRWHALVNDLHDCIADLEESDKRLEWAYPKEGDDDAASL